MTGQSRDSGKEVLRQIIEGLEGVTPGTWDFRWITPADGFEYGATITGEDRDGNGCPVIADLPPRTIHGTHQANAEHIARCHPNAMRAIAEYVAALEADLDAVTTYAAVLEAERDNARNDEWLAAISAVQFMSANWWQDCRSEVERNALQAVTEDVISALRSVGPTEYLDVQWKGAEAAMAAEEKAERLQRELSETEALREEGTAKIADLTLALSTARRTALLEARRQAFDEVGQKAREYAAHYPEASDGRNTFIIFAEWAEGKING